MKAIARSAGERELGDLHANLAKIIKAEMSDPERRSPALLNVARQFLKDNGISCVGEENDDLKEIREKIPVFSAEDDALI